MGPITQRPKWFLNRLTFKKKFFFIQSISLFLFYQKQAVRQLTVFIFKIFSNLAIRHLTNTDAVLSELWIWHSVIPLSTSRLHCCQGQANQGKISPGPYKRKKPHFQKRPKCSLIKLKSNSYFKSKQLLPGWERNKEPYQFYLPRWLPTKIIS